MREKIDRFSKGIFDYRLPEIRLSEECLSLSVMEGGQCGGSFRIGNAAHRRMRAFLFCDAPELELACRSFEGEEQEIAFTCHGEYLTAGQKRSGEICIVSSLGEIGLPFEITVTGRACETSMGPMSDLTKFADLARASWEEARELFLSEAFPGVFLKDTKELLLYRGLCRSSSGDQAMEEFLRAVCGKAPVKLTLEKKELEYHLAGRSMRDSIRISKEGWGLVEAGIRVESVGPAFLRLEKDRLEQSDFTAGVCELPVVLEPEKLKRGRGTALVRIVTADQELVLQVTLHSSDRSRKRTTAVSKQKSYINRLLQNHIHYRLGDMTKDEYVISSRAVLYGLQVLEEAHWPELVGVWLNMLGGRTPMSLDRLQEMAEQLAEQYPKEWHYSWLRQIAEKADRRPDERIRLYREIFQTGCRSPLLYVEAWLAFREAPEQLVRLEEFEVQVMNWARKQKLTEGSLPSRYVFLAESSRSDRTLVYDFLRQIQEVRPDPEALNAICRMLLRKDSRGERRHRDCHRWYRLGVEQGLRITGLYEAYMETFDWSGEEEPDGRVYTYFRRDNGLSSQRKAAFYAHIIRQKEKQLSVYQNYLEQMKEFAAEQIRAGACSGPLAEIYEDLLEKPDFAAQVQKDLPKVLFRSRVLCDIPGMKGVWVWHAEEEEEVFAPLEQGCACVDICTDHVSLLLEDDRGRRYAVSGEYQWKPLLSCDRWLNYCYEAGSRDRRLLLALSAHRGQDRRLDGPVLQQEVLELQGLASACRHEVMGSLIRYCREQMDGEMLEQYLAEYDLEYARPQERTQLMEWMLQRDMAEPAEKAVRRYGFEGISLKYLRRFGSRKLAETAGRDEFILRLCWYLFCQESYGSDIMVYLIRYYQGSAHSLGRIREVAVEAGLDTGDLEERLLGQMLFTEKMTGQSEAVYRAYRDKVYREKQGTGRKLLRAFLAYRAYRYLVSDLPVEAGLFRHMKEEVFYDDTLLCKAAVLKAYSEKESLTAEEKEFAEHQMELLAMTGCILPFFRKFVGKCRVPAGVEHSRFAVYIGEPGELVDIHYRIPGPEEPYRTEPMREVFYGIHVKELLLYYGEKAQYYVTAAGETGAEEKEPPEGAIREIREDADAVFKSGEDAGVVIDNDGESYALLNRIRMARESGDTAARLALMEQYVRQDHVREKLFRPL